MSQLPYCNSNGKRELSRSYGQSVFYIYYIHYKHYKTHLFCFGQICERTFLFVISELAFMNKSKWQFFFVLKLQIFWKYVAIFIKSLEIRRHYFVATLFVYKKSVLGLWQLSTHIFRSSFTQFS